MKPKTVSEVCELYKDISNKFEKEGNHIIKHHELHIHTRREEYKFRNATKVVELKDGNTSKMTFHGCPEDPVTRDIGVRGTICITKYSEICRKIEIVNGWVAYSEEA